MLFRSGTGTKRIRSIFNYKGENHLINENVPCESDQFTHLYTLVVRPDNTYTISVDGEERRSGSLEDDWDMLEPKKILDPSKPKPADWVDEAQIPDPEEVKPEGWDDIEEFIEDPDAERPDDWDDELDGEYEAPQIPNPEYKGEWRPKMIDNPDYKGEYVQPEIDNPDFVEDPNLYSFDSHAFVGFEIWQVKAGTIFDSIIVTDSEAEAKAFADETFFATRDGEKEMKNQQDEEARIKAEEEAEARRQEEEAEEDDEEVEEESNEKDEL